MEEGADPDFELSAGRTTLRGSKLYLEFTNGSWIEDVVPMFDRFEVSDGATTHILAHIMRVGKIVPSEVIFSESTVDRTRDQEWCQNLLRLALAEHDTHVALGFDTKKVKLGVNQGDVEKEHVVITVQGVSGPKLLGIYQAEDGKGKCVSDEPV